MIMTKANIRVSEKELVEQRLWRIKKYGSPWLSAVDTELAWRYDNNVPMGLNYKEAREWLKKRIKK